MQECEIMGMVLVNSYGCGIAGVAVKLVNETSPPLVPVPISQVSATTSYPQTMSTDTGQGQMTAKDALFQLDR